MQSSTIKTAINFMIYGITIFLNDVNFKAKVPVQSRMSVQAFYTNLHIAKKNYQYHLRKWQNEKGISYGNREQRGRAELYKAEVRDGRVMEHGKIILSETI